MGTARQKAEDMRNAALMSLIANINRDPKKKSTPFSPSDFMPGIEKKAPKGNFNMLKDAFVKKK